MDIKKLIEFFQEEENITRAARRFAQEQGIEYNDSFRRKCSLILNKQDLDISETTTSTAQYKNDSLAEEKDPNLVSNPNMEATKADGTLMNIDEYCIAYNLDRSQIRSWKLVSHTSRAYYNISFYNNSNEANLQEEFARNLVREISELSIQHKTYERKLISDAHLLVVDACDVHIGKLCDSFEVGEDYNNQIAVQRVQSGVQSLIDKSKAFNIDKILFVGGNDILHIDNTKSSTTSGTMQDTSGMWYSNFLIAKSLYIEVLESLLKVADVHFVFNPSNHDYMSGFFLADVIKTYFKDNPHITFDSDMSHRKYFTYGTSLICTTHGDGAKQADLPLLMAHESGDWSKCKHRYIYSHHLHHKVAKDYIGVTFEAMRSPSGTDSWHHRNGYTGVPKAIEGFIHSKNYGQIARLTQLFSLVLAPILSYMFIQ